jgi:thymidylate synthase
MHQKEIAMQQYLKLLKKVARIGKRRGDRTGVGTYGVFVDQLRFDLQEGFPLLTTKQVHWNSVVNELLWFIAGRTDAQWLQQHNTTIWNEWATEEQCAKFDRPVGQLGPVYGHQWRNFGASLASPDQSTALILASRKPDGCPVTYSHIDVSTGKPIVFNHDGFDQLSWVINEIKTNPQSRRLVVTGWNPADANRVCLPPCHTLFQFYVSDRKLSCHVYMRSTDVFLGLPFNIASYALLTHMVAHVCGLGVGELVYTGGDVHLYSNHLVQANTQLARTPTKQPALLLDRNVTDLFAFSREDITLIDYEHQGKIAAPVAV